jgi:hypothetical protein
MRGIGGLAPVVVIVLTVLCTTRLQAVTGNAEGPLTRSEREVLSGWQGDARFGLGFEYEIARYELDSPTYSLPFRLETADVQTFCARLQIRVTDRFDVWGRVGLSDVDAGDFTASQAMTYGAGLRGQILRWGPWSWDGAAQLTAWSIKKGDSTVDIPVPDGNSVKTATVTRGSLDDLEWLIKTGPAWNEGPFTVYGGVAARYSEADLSFPATVDGNSFSLGFNANGKWHLGGYAGAAWQLSKPRIKALGPWSPDLTLRVEGAATGGSSCLTVGLIIAPSGVRQ